MRKQNAKKLPQDLLSKHSLLVGTSFVYSWHEPTRKERITPLEKLKSYNKPLNRQCHGTLLFLGDLNYLIQKQQHSLWIKQQYHMNFTSQDTHIKIFIFLCGILYLTQTWKHWESLNTSSHPCHPGTSCSKHGLAICLEVLKPIWFFQIGS